MIPLTKDKLERIAFSKYLLAQAKIHKDKGVPIASFTVLILHDLLEIFLQVAVEVHVPHLDKPKSKVLETLTNGLNKLLSEKGSSINMQFINRVNERRNGLKHATIFVNIMDIQNLYAETETFFNDFCEILFDLKPNEISLVSMISNEKVRNHLYEAEKQIEKGDFFEAVQATTKAYHYLQHQEREAGKNATDVVRGNYRRNLSLRGKSMRSTTITQELKELSEMIEKDIRALNETVTDLEAVVRLGIDYKSYIKFKALIPHIYLPNTRDKRDSLYFFEISAERRAQYNFNGDDARFCFHVVLSVSLELENLG